MVDSLEATRTLASGSIFELEKVRLVIHLNLCVNLTSNT